MGCLVTITPPKCKTCGKVEWRHSCAGPAPTLKEVRDATAALERAFPSNLPGRQAGKATDFDSVTAGSSPAPATKPYKPTPLRAAALDKLRTGIADGTVTIVHPRAHKLSPEGRKAIAAGLLAKAEEKAAKLKPSKKRNPRMAKAGRKPVKTDARSLAARKRMADKRAADKLKAGTAKAPKPDTVKP